MSKLNGRSGVWLVLVILALWFGMGVSGWSLGPKPTTAEVKAQVISTIDLLERDPYNKKAKQYRGGVLKWLAEAPDVSVTLCADLLGDWKNLKADDGDVLVSQLAFSEAKHILEHPEQATDYPAVHLAGVLGALRTYQSMREAKPKLELEPMERLLRLRADGKLEEHVRSATAKCHSK